MYDEDGYIDITKASKTDIDNTIKIGTWILDRIESISDYYDRVEEHYFTNNGDLEIQFSDVSYYCGESKTTYHSYTIPREIFFSDANLWGWISEENDKRKQAEELKRKKEEERKKKHRRKEAAIKAVDKERRERSQYEKLKLKYEQKD